LIQTEIKGLIDTGGLLAVLDRDDAWHDRCVEGRPSKH